MPQTTVEGTATIRVGFYLAAVAEELTSGGVSPYAWRLLDTLLSAALPVELTILATRSQLPRVKSLLATASTPARVHVVRVEPRWLRGLHRPFEDLAQEHDIRPAAEVGRLLNPLDHLARRLRLDVMHCPTQSFPFRLWRTPTIITMHDVQELHFPEFFSPRERLGRARGYWFALKSAAAVIVSYEHVKLDIIKYFRIPAEKVYVCSLPFSNDWLADADAELIAGIRAKYELPEQFLLYPAQTWPHKNHAGLLQALAHIREESGEKLALVCTGALNAHTDEVKALARRLELSDSVRFLGVIPRKDLSALYQVTQLVVIPTLYEAGSFPLLEAMMSGTPVVCARTTSLPETIGDERFTFDPRDPTDMAATILKVMRDPKLRAENVENSARRIHEVAAASATSAKQFLEVYQHAAAV